MGVLVKRADGRTNNSPTRKQRRPRGGLARAERPNFTRNCRLHREVSFANLKGSTAQLAAEAKTISPQLAGHSGSSQLLPPTRRPAGRPARQISRQASGRMGSAGFVGPARSASPSAAFSGRQRRPLMHWAAGLPGAHERDSRARPSTRPVNQVGRARLHLGRSWTRLPKREPHRLHRPRSSVRPAIGGNQAPIIAMSVMNGLLLFRRR